MLPPEYTHLLLIVDDLPYVWGKYQNQVINILPFYYFECRMNLALDEENDEDSSKNMNLEMDIENKVVVDEKKQEKSIFAQIASKYYENKKNYEPSLKFMESQIESQSKLLSEEEKEEMSKNFNPEMDIENKGIDEKKENNIFAQIVAKYKEKIKDYEQSLNLLESKIEDKSKAFSEKEEKRDEITEKASNLIKNEQNLKNNNLILTKQKSDKFVITCISKNDCYLYFLPFVLKSIHNLFFHLKVNCLKKVR